MQIPVWLRPLLLTGNVLPGMVFCYLPMGNQLKYPRKKIAGMCLAAYLVFEAAAAAAYAQGNGDVNLILIPSLVIFFFLYRRTLKTDLSRALAVFLSGCTLMTYPVHFSYMLDAWLHPDAGISDFFPEGALLLCPLSALMILLIAIPVRRLLGWEIDQLDIPKAWNAISTIAVLFLSINLLVVPADYRTLYSGRMFLIYLVFELWCMAVQVFLHWVFYLTSISMVERAEQEQQARLWEMQASQYQSLRSHMQETARLRHDFRQSARILSTLADKEDWDSLRSYLANYSQSSLSSSNSSAANWCANAALNALFSHYYDRSISAGIRIDWQLALPEPLTISELDLASLFGNLIENAVAGCLTVPGEQRYFSLSAAMRQGGRLYIVSTNSFNGHVERREGEYLSTRQGGRGIGLPSISAVAEKYQGSARFSNNETEFWADIVLKL